MNLDLVRQEILNLLATVPELAEDDVLRADMIEAETTAHEFLRLVEERRRDAVAMMAGIDKTVDTLSARRQRFARREWVMRDLMMKVLDAAGLRKVELPEATLSIANGSRKVIITDDTSLPDEACRFVREPNKTLIKSWIEGGTIVRGATLSNAEPHLVVRTR